MKILVLIGSQRRHGNTEQMTDLISEALTKEAERVKEPLGIETVYLGQQEIHFCRGCRICYDRGEEHCPLMDDVPVLEEKMLAADGILMASPVYVDDVSGLVKTFIDRLCHVCHRPELAGKVGFVVATTGRSRTSKTLATMSLALRTWGVHLAGQSGYVMGALMKPEETRARYAESAARDAQRFFTAIYQQSYRNPSFLSLMVFKIQQESWRTRTPKDSLDYRYYVEKGWFESDCTFYFPHRAGWIKVALARLSGGIIQRLVAQ